MKTAGVSLDYYDDPNSELLKRSFPTLESLPDVIKVAHILTSEEREILRDDAYALILHNEGKTLRKFACVDAGNTLLSALYLAENADKLPEEAVKVAAANLEEACKFFDLPLHSLEKIAGHKERPPTAAGRGASRSRDPFQQPLVGDEADWAERTNLVSVRGGADSGRVVPTANQMKTAAIGMGLVDAKKKLGLYPGGKAQTKTAQDHVDDAQERADNKRAGFKPTAPKKDDINLDSFHKLNPEADPKKKSKNSTKHHWAKKANVVDVSELEAPPKMIYAPGFESYEGIQKAIEYFTEHILGMQPEQRHDFAVKTAARATELGIPLTEDLERYGSTEYAPDVEAHLANRRALAPDHAKLFNELQEKRASVEPVEFVQLLASADEEASLNWYYGGPLADPYYATFGGNKVKEANITWSWQSRTGDYVSGTQLKKLALNGRPLVEKQFTKDLADAFSMNPIAIFESLPDLQKKVLARLASQEFDGTPNN